MVIFFYWLCLTHWTLHTRKNICCSVRSCAVGNWWDHLYFFQTSSSKVTTTWTQIHHPGLQDCSEITFANSSGQKTETLGSLRISAARDFADAALQTPTFCRCFYKSNANHLPSGKRLQIPGVLLDHNWAEALSLRMITNTWISLSLFPGVSEPFLLFQLWCLAMSRHQSRLPEITVCSVLQTSLDRVRSQPPSDHRRACLTAALWDNVEKTV